MTDRNVNRPGYKKTRVGWIPEEWEVKRFSEVAKVNPRKPQDISDDMIVGFVPMANVSESGELIKFDEVLCEEVNSGYTFFEDGDILVAKITPSFENGKGCLVTSLPNGVGFGSTEFHVLRSKNINAQFLFYHTKSYPFRVKGGLNMTGTAGQKRVPTDYLKNYRIPVPSDTEQREIVDILNTWGCAIKQTQKLIDAKQRLKRGLMQQLLTGRLRFPGFGPPVDSVRALPSGWERVSLSTFFKEKSHRNNDETDFVLSCSKLYGIISQEERFDKRIASKNLSRYKVVQKGDLVYDPMLLWDASIGFVEDYSIGCVSPAYNTFEFIGEDDKLGFVKYSLFTQRMRYMYKAISQGTNRRRRKAPSKDFLKIKIPLPRDEVEIQKIIDVVTLVDEELSLLKNKLLFLINEKKGLMQIVMSGQKRVKGL